MSNNKKILPVILCGGTGSRLWPLSRESFPKQYLFLDPLIKKSFLQITLERLKGEKNIDNPIIICNEMHRFITAEQLREINIKAKSILLEPFGKNTAAAVALSAMRCLEEGNDQILLVMPSDHKIDDIETFLKTIETAIVHAENGKLLAFGISPKSAETGYGYIKSKKELVSNNFQGEIIEEFIEKPPKNIAEQLIIDKRYSWNSGIYIFKASSIIKEIKKYSPEILIHCQDAFKNREMDLYFEKIEEMSFKKCPNISIDKAVMEKTNQGVVFSLDIGWSDIGGWKSFWENSSKDADGNSIMGDAIGISTKNSLLRSEKRLLVALGIEDLIVIETSDAILVAKKDFSENIKELVQILHKKGIKEGKEHKKGYRPWGNYLTIEEGETWKVKRIEVNPGASLSLQMHQCRSEHWVVVYGIANITIEGKTFQLKNNESCYVPKGHKHRLSNSTKEPLIIIEVQSGSYLGEDDIYRYDDNYGRKNKI